MPRRIIVNRVYLEEPDMRVLPEFPPLMNLRLDLLESKERVNKNSVVHDTITTINNRNDPKPIHPAMSHVNIHEYEPAKPPLFNNQFDYDGPNTPIKSTSSTPSPLKFAIEPEEENRFSEYDHKDSKLQIEDIIDEDITGDDRPQHIENIIIADSEHNTPIIAEDWKTSSPPIFSSEAEQEPENKENVRIIAPEISSQPPQPVKQQPPPSSQPPPVSVPPTPPAVEIIKKTPEQLEKEQVTKWRWAHTLLKERWPQANLPEITDYMDSQTLKDKYYENMRTLVLKNNIDSYREYLLLLSGAIEFGSIMIFDMKTLNGLTRFHFKNMHKYHHLLVEMGESNEHMLGASFPAWVRLLIYIVFQTVIFWLLQYAQQKGGNSKLKNMLSFFTGETGGSSNTQSQSSPEEQTQTEQEMKKRDGMKKNGKIPPPMSADQIRKLRR